MPRKSRPRRGEGTVYQRASDGLWVGILDWDTAGLALPERDLWAVADADSREGERYAELTGRRVGTAAMRMYPMRWSLDDITLSLSDLRGPHEQNEDTELA